MADITLDDLLHWQLGYTFRAAAGMAPNAGLERPISWAVTIRATAPVLPSLRGGELIIAPPRLLEQLEAGESFNARDLATMLAAQPIAALLVAPDFSETALPGVPLLVRDGAFPHDAEAVLNRLLTQRRAQLYNLGSDLSRVLTTSSMSGAGLDALLAGAARVCGRRLVLLDATGDALATSDADEDPPPLSGNTLESLLGHAGSPRPLRAGDATWLALGVRQSGQERRAAVLLIGPVTSGTGDVDRLVLTQTAQTLELLLSQAAGAGRFNHERANREALAADLLRGTLASREAADARARLLGLDPAVPTRVVLATWRTAAAPARVYDVLASNRRLPRAQLSETELAVLVPAGDRFDTVWRELVAAAHADGAALLLVASDIVHGPAFAAAATRQARTLAQLARAGAVTGPVVDARDMQRAGVYGLLLPLATGNDGLTESGPQRLAAFANAFLAPLETYDARRDGQLVDTLAAWLRVGGALAEAARSLNVHRNTLSYRLGRIAELTGLDLACPRTRFLLQLALAARDLGRAEHADE